ncbi:MAG: anion permease [Deltaproteobacteria bacterium]|nr:anion permease [Deltaproteobacteria bacterium]
MESLAAVLRRVPIFANLPRGSFATIIADLREEQHAPGAVICYEGDAAQDFYIIKSGSVAVFVNRGNQRELIAVSGPHEWFGERALFSDRPRSATVVARTEVVVWRLTKEKFDGLIEENPRLILHFTQVLSDRLYRGNQDFSKVQAAFSNQMEALFRKQSEERRRLLARSAILGRLEPRVIEALTDVADAADMLSDLERDGGFVIRREGALSYLDAVREYLLSQLAQEIGADGVKALHLRAAKIYVAEGRWDRAVVHYIDGDDFFGATTLIDKHLEPLIADRRVDLLRGWLEQIPAAIVAEQLPNVYQRLERAAGGKKRRPVPGMHGLRARSAILAVAWPWIGAALGLMAGGFFALRPPFEGLSVEGMRMLALLAWAAVFWAFDVLPDYVVGLVMILGWIIFGVVPAEVAVSGFTTGPFFLIIGVLGIGASLQSSGFLFRMALQILRRFPLTHRGQSLGLALSGTAITPGIPDVTSGVAIASPIILALSDTLGYARRSNGSAGLAMAAVLGFGQMSPFFLTGAAENLLAWGLLPEASRGDITWMGWFLAALPLAVVTFALAFVATMLLLPPETQPTVSPGLIETQIEALGPLSNAEIVNAVVLIGAVIGWVTGPYHGIDAAWVAMIGLAILLAANFLDRVTFRSGIYWDFLFYLGAVLSLTSVVRHLHVDAWVIRLLTPFVEPMTARPSVFLLALALSVFASRFVLPSFPLVSVLVITLAPIAIPAGIKAMALTLVICTTTAVWFLPYQSTYYLALYFGTKEKAFSHSQVRLVAWSYGLIYLTAIALALPYWRYLGLLP